jgi:hypothetical protein
MLDIFFGGYNNFGMLTLSVSAEAVYGREHRD